MSFFTRPLLFLFILLSSTALFAEQESEFTPFTGKVRNQRVRLRTEPHTDSHIVKELNRGDLFVVVGEKDDFYIVQPPKDLKAYVYRTFVMDNVIEGNRVNIRLTPTLESPVIAQMNSGDPIYGQVSSENSKWYEITPPESTRFYVSKDFIENVGDKDYLVSIEKRKKEIDFLISQVQKMGQDELDKSFECIQLDETYGYIEKILHEYGDFPSHVAEAKKLQAEFKQEYLQKKIHYLENQAQKSQNYAEEMREHQEQLQVVEQELQRHKDEYKPSDVESIVEKAQEHCARTEQMEQWIPAEEHIYLVWLDHQPSGVDTTKEAFYADQRNQSVEMRGVIEPYRKAIKNRPGDYILVNHSNSLPIAYLYSTKVNLQDYVGRDATVSVVRRPNNNFAFPAYYVLEVSSY